VFKIKSKRWRTWGCFNGPIRVITGAENGGVLKCGGVRNGGLNEEALDFMEMMSSFAVVVLSIEECVMSSMMVAFGRIFSFKAMVGKLGLKTEKHQSSYKIGWIKQGVKTQVTDVCRVPFSISKVYMDMTLCDLVEMDGCHMIFCRLR
jgi:hypothetical protein